MSRPTDIQVRGARVYLLPVPTRMPLKFGAATVTEVCCARVALRVVNRSGRVAEGWGETPLSVQWGWPSPVPYEERLRATLELCRRIASTWVHSNTWGHPLEIGWDFVEHQLPALHREFNQNRQGEPMPWLNALITASAFDLALHDAFGNAVDLPIYSCYGSEYLSRDLSAYLQPAAESGLSFRGQYPADYLKPRENSLTAWHLVGGLDPIEAGELRGDEPRDKHPVLLEDWIKTDGLRCLKIKLCGTDADWDYRRLVSVGQLALRHEVEALSADFNCTVQEPEYVNEVLDRLQRDRPQLFRILLYVEQPFAYDLEANPMDVRSVSGRKPLFLDESAHDWRLVRFGRELGWTGVALKTCKTQSGALLSLCWARAHGLSLMVQDLTNPMLAQLPHLLLAAHAGTLRGVETNSMQFYPDASLPEAAVHPGCYSRRHGRVELSTLQGAGFGYRLSEIARKLPAPDLSLDAEDPRNFSKPVSSPS